MSSILERKIYEQINRLQEQRKDDIKYAQSVLEKEEKRRDNVAGRSTLEIIRHPCNKAIWFRLANFMQETDVDEHAIMTRLQQRQAIRREMEEKKEGGKKEKQIAAPKVKKQELPWKLRTALRQQEVQENKRRIDKIRQTQEQKARQHHK